MGCVFVIFHFHTCLPVINIIYNAVESIPSGNHNFLEVLIFVGVSTSTKHVEYVK